MNHESSKAGVRQEDCSLKLLHTYHLQASASAAACSSPAGPAQTRSTCKCRDVFYLGHTEGRNTQKGGNITNETHKHMEPHTACIKLTLTALLHQAWLLCGSPHRPFFSQAAVELAVFWCLAFAALSACAVLHLCSPALQGHVHSPNSRLLRAPRPVAMQHLIDCLFAVLCVDE